ncbi:ANTH domain-containing protein [Myxozyma melibiosi]|uniref:ANTH domain-containing protein n=1 Tax=Myxozyma melibiosi TaxID=54550 RepID=A0ABR1FB73_9ASCO
MGYDKVVKGATKVKLAAPKIKYIEPILQGTSNESDLEDIFRTLSIRLRDSAWTVVYKSLIVVHIMIREGRKDVTLEYLARHGRMLDTKHMTFENAGAHAEIIHRYSRYLLERVRQYANLKIDYVRHKKDNPTKGRLRTLSVEKGLLREIESVQSQLHYLLMVKYPPDDDISLTAFRFLVFDLLALHQAVNEGVINMLEHYFEMSHYDAERALDIYKYFTKDMDGVVEYLQLARRLESATKLSVPNIKHAPTSLTQSLEDYLNDPEFEMNRRQFLAQKEAKLAAHRSDADETPLTKVLASEGFAPVSPQQPQQPQQQQPAQVVQQPVYVDQNGMVLNQPPFEQTNPFPVAAQQFQQPQQPQFQQGTFTGMQQGQQQAPLAPDFTGAGFGGYTSQSQAQSYPTAPLPIQPQPTGFMGPAPENGYMGLFSSQAQPQQQSVFMTGQQQQPLTAQPTGSTNPFRQATTYTGISPQFTGSGSGSGTASTSNPFHLARPPSSNLGAVPENGDAALVSRSPTKTNPFAIQRSTTTVVAPPIQSLQAAQTGSNNPFRKSTF